MWQDRLVELLTSPVPTVETNPQIVIPVFRPASATCVVAPLTTASVVVLPLNLNRRRIILHNDSGAVIYVKYGPVCSTSLFTFRIAANDKYDGPMGDYTGPVSAIRASGTGNLLVTEIVT